MSYLLEIYYRKKLLEFKVNYYIAIPLHANKYCKNCNSERSELNFSSQWTCRERVRQGNQSKRILMIKWTSAECLKHVPIQLFFSLKCVILFLTVASLYNWVGWESCGRILNFHQCCQNKPVFSLQLHRQCEVSTIERRGQCFYSRDVRNYDIVLYERLVLRSTNIVTWNLHNFPHIIQCNSKLGTTCTSRSTK